MTRPSDTFVLYIILILILYLFIRNWLPTTFSQWVKRSAKDKTMTITGEIPDLLRSKGYQVTNAKNKIPLSFSITEDQSGSEKNYSSRLYVDFLAKKDGAVYLVFVEKQKRLLPNNGPGLRDRFLAPFLIYRPQGILFIKQDKQLILLEMEVPDHYQPPKKSRSWYYLGFFILGMLFHWLT